MKRNLLLFLSTFLPMISFASSEIPRNINKISINNPSAEQSLFEKLEYRGRVETRDAADSGRSTGGGHHCVTTEK
ncbi:MAG: hypothetical protein H7336_06125 [Bacteriovorax sp.]|nr:hypothetical protein [Bacteriovorax sp.]